MLFISTEWLRKIVFCKRCSSQRRQKWADWRQKQRWVLTAGGGKRGPEILLGIPSPATAAGPWLCHSPRHLFTFCPPRQPPKPSRLLMSSHRHLPCWRQNLRIRKIHFIDSARLLYLNTFWPKSIGYAHTLTVGIDSASSFVTTISWSSLSLMFLSLIS